MIKMAILIIIGITAVIGISISLAGMIPDKPNGKKTSKKKQTKNKITTNCKDFS